MRFLDRKARKMERVHEGFGSAALYSQTERVMALHSTALLLKTAWWGPFRSAYQTLNNNTAGTHRRQNFFCEFFQQSGCQCFTSRRGGGICARMCLEE